MLQSSLAVVPVALREHRVGSLPLSQAGCTKQGPPSLSLPSFEGTMVQGKRKRPTLNRGPKMTQQHVPTWSLFRPHRTTLKKRPALKKKTWCHTEELALLLHFTLNVVFSFSIEPNWEATTACEPTSPASLVGIHLVTELNHITSLAKPSGSLCSYRKTTTAAPPRPRTVTACVPYWLGKQRGRVFW